MDQSTQPTLRVLFRWPAVRGDDWTTYAIVTTPADALVAWRLLRQRGAMCRIVASPAVSV